MPWYAGWPGTEQEWQETLVGTTFDILHELHQHARSELGPCSRQQVHAYVGRKALSLLEGSRLWQPGSMEVEPDHRPTGTVSDINVHLDVLTSYDTVRVVATYVNDDARTMTLLGAVRIV